MSHVDWEKIKAEYLQGGTSYRKLADKHGVPFSTLEKKARSENWTEQRKEVGEKAATKARQKIVSQRAKDIELLDRSRTLLIQ
ncbi:MAG: helix-turn-helix domain-containing protein, partial [Christensenellales bacterium]|nr:helix-turn-helix domain-containing protein [Christensenellales bacterium]